jgi:hypothetical protein
VTTDDTIPWWRGVQKENLDGCPEGLWLTHRAGVVVHYAGNAQYLEGGSEEGLLIKVKPK